MSHNNIVVLVALVALAAISQIIIAQNTGASTSHVVLHSSYASFHERAARIQAVQQKYVDTLESHAYAEYPGELSSTSKNYVTRYQVSSPHAFKKTASYIDRYGDDVERREAYEDGFRDSAEQSEEAVAKLRQRSIVLRNEYRGQKDWKHSLYRKATQP